jgi:hypothetical protein
MERMLQFKQVDDELEAANRYRAQKLEGRARVCARRAAGWAIALLRERHEGHFPHWNAYQQLRWLQNFEDAPQELREAAARLTTRVTTNHELPHADDPLEDAQMIILAVRKILQPTKNRDHE